MKLLRPLLVLFVALSVLTGLAYPFAIAGVGTLLFARQAAGSFVERNGKVIGSELIGQSFSDPGHFWSRPSATSPMADNPLASGGSNLGPLNPALVDAVKGRLAALRAADPDNRAPVPVDLVTASASGVDPDISVAAARYQAARVARARGLPVATVQRLLEAHVQHKWLGVFGEERVNVLRLNLALDALADAAHPRAPSPPGPAPRAKG
jgi:K+-transporting ATPase ATPase C chain